MAWIIGAGGGGGGGASRAPVESPDSLQSRQYARLLDLVSEGPIEGLVAGAQSVYLDGVALQNNDGSFNFNGVAFDSRNGTQAQAAIPGFDAIEAESAVSVEVEYATSVTRTLTNANLTAARVTLGIPQLTSQDPATGDLRGTTVQMAIDLQTNGGGFVPLVIGVDYVPATYYALLHYRTPSNASGFSISVVFYGYQVPDPGGESMSTITGGTTTVSVEYRLVGAPTWTTLVTETLAYPLTTALVASANALPVGEYEFRVTPTDSLTVNFAKALIPSAYDLITGKTTTRYQRSYRIPLSGGGPWDIRVRRLTADSTTVNVRDNVWWESLTEIIDQRLRYPNSALIALQADASNFRAAPTRGYDLRGLLLQVPSNYNPADRSYTGIWDGTFQTLWSDNPAWVFYDILTNDRYGLGALIDPALVDKWTLYTIAQYCDALVPDGFGTWSTNVSGQRVYAGQWEPRFTCNIYLQTQEDAYKVLTGLASVFRSMVFWGGGGVSCAQDAPQEPSALYANANVIDGVFTYQGTARSARHTIALVSWNDPADMYKAKLEYVEDLDGVARYGVRQTEVMAMGCTSRGQAHRLGRWLLYTERMETEVVSFRAGMDSLRCLPGEVIQIADAPKAGARIGGRLATCTATTATLDAAVTLAGGETYTVSMVTADGIVTRPVTTAAGSTNTLTWTTALTTVPPANSLWVLSASNLEPTTWRVISVSDPEKNIVEVTALAHNASKFAAIEQDLQLEIPPTSLVYIGPPLPVTNLTLSESMYREEPVRIVVRLTAGWTPPAMGLSGYDVRVRPNNGNWRLVRRTSESTIDIDGMTPGLWEVSVTAVSSTGQLAPAVTSSINLIGELAPPSDVTGFVATANDSGIHLGWADSPDVDIGDYEIRYGASWATATSLVFTKSTAWLDEPRAPGSHTYWVAARDLMGNLSVNPVSSIAVVTAASAPGVSAAFSGGNCVLTWTPPVSGSFSVTEYEIRHGADWASGTSLGKIKGTTHTLLAQWSGARNFWVAAYDLLGNVGAVGGSTATVTPAAAPVLTSQGIDNNVLLYWSQVQGTLPTTTYEVRKGATWAGATLIGAKSGGFTTIFETVSGTYTYWVAAIDSAGNYGTPASVAATVSQPPDYVLRANHNSALQGVVWDFDDGTAEGWAQINGSAGVEASLLRVGANLLAYSQDFTVAGVWGGGNYSLDANVATAPDGTLTASRMTDTSSSAEGYLAQFVTVPDDTLARTASIYLKQGTMQRPVLWVQYNIGASYYGLTVVLDLATGVIVSQSGYGTATLTSVGGGWYRVAVTITNGLAGVNAFHLRLQAENWGLAGVETGNVYLWGAQLEVASQASAYAKTTAISGDQSLVLSAMPAMAPYGRQYFMGCEWPALQVRLRRLTGAGSDTGNGKASCLYARYDANGANYRNVSGSYMQQSAEALPTVAEGWRILNFDMSNLMVGGTDWLISRIDALRFDFGNTLSDAFEIDWIRAVPGALSNLLLEDGSYLGPVNTTETFADHFTTRSWAGPDAQIAAGYPIYVQPNASPAYYEETLDYGTVLASSKVTVTANVQVVTGTVTPTGKISVSTDNAVWTDYDNTWSVYATNFRYVKVRVTLTAAGNTDLVRLLGLNIRIDAKLKTHTAMLSCVSTDSGGTTLYLTDDGTSGGNKLFVDVDAISVSVQGTTPITAVYDFVDAPDPLSLKVLLFNAAGARVSGTASVTVRGF